MNVILRVNTHTHHTHTKAAKKRYYPVASASGYKSVGPSSIPDEDGADLTQVFILHWSING